MAEKLTTYDPAAALVDDDEVAAFLTERNRRSSCSRTQARKAAPPDRSTPVGVDLWREDRQNIRIEQISRRHSNPGSRITRAERLFGRSSGWSGGTANRRSAKDGARVLSLIHSE
jgi:hypothetical protein